MEVFPTPKIWDIPFVLSVPPLASHPCPEGWHHSAGELAQFESLGLFFIVSAKI